MKYDASIRRRDSSPQILHIRWIVRGRKQTTPLVMNQIFFFLFKAEGPRFTSGREMRAGNGERGVRRVIWEGGAAKELMLSVRLCLSSALQVLHRSFHGKCTGTDYRWLERVRKRERERGGSEGWFCSQKMSSRVSSLQIPDYAHPYNCFTLSSDLFTFFIYSGIQQVSLALSTVHFLKSFHRLLYRKKQSFLQVNKQSNFSTHTRKHRRWFTCLNVWNFALAVRSPHLYLLICETFLKKVHMVQHSVLYVVCRIKGLQSLRPHGQLRRKPFCGFSPCIFWSPWIHPATCALWKMRWLQTTRGEDGMPSPQGEATTGVICWPKLGLER